MCKGILLQWHSSWLLHMHTVDYYVGSWYQCKYLFVSKPNDDKIIAELCLIMCSEQLTFIQWFASVKSWTCQFFSKDISQGSVVTYLRYDGFFNRVTTLLQIYSCIYQCYEFGVSLFYWTRCTLGEVIFL